MATKINRAGNQQPYVPAGNGDASGEYADNAYGNVHYKASGEEGKSGSSGTGIIITEKPKPQKPTPEKPLEKPVENGGNNTQKNSGQHAEKISMYILSHSNMSKKSLELVKADIDTGTEEAQEKLNTALQKHNYSFKMGKSSCYMSGGQGSMVLASKSLKSLSRNPGETFWHENGHLIDYSNIDPSEPTMSRAGKTLSATYISKKDGKTLFQSVLDEGREFARNREAFDEILSEKDTLQQKYLSEIGYDKDKLAELQQKRDAIDVELKKDPRFLQAIQQRDEAREKYRQSYSMEDYRKVNEAFSNIATVYENLANEHKEYNQIREQIEKMGNASYEAKLKASQEFTRKYSSLSDMLDASTQGYSNLGVGFHGRKYWRSSEYMQSHEFFAEVFSAYARNSQEELGVIKKYFPRSVEIVEEIVKEYK